MTSQLTLDSDYSGAIRKAGPPTPLLLWLVSPISCIIPLTLFDHAPPIDDNHPKIWHPFDE